MARDAMGIKLIYYRIANGQLNFGSEIRAVLAAEDSRPEVDPVAVNLFLRFRYTPSPLTIFQGVRKLAAGTMLVVEQGRVPRGAMVQLPAGSIFEPEGRQRGHP